nr:hypothetical protein CFP56_27831 [Quercus suber]
MSKLVQISAQTSVGCSLNCNVEVLSLRLLLRRSLNCGLVWATKAEHVFFLSVFSVICCLYGLFTLAKLQANG